MKTVTQLIIGLTIMFGMVSTPVYATDELTFTEQQNLRVTLLAQVKELIQILNALLAEQERAQISNPANPIVQFETSYGTIELELFADMMPITTTNFLELAEDNFYDETKFHRVIEGFMIQGGDPNTKNDNQLLYGTGGPGYTISDEHVMNQKLTNIRGTIAMANAGPNSGGSQFFINVADNKNLDFDKQPLSSQHPVFGKVISGMSVVDTIATLETGPTDIPLQSVVVYDVVIENVK